MLKKIILRFARGCNATRHDTVILGMAITSKAKIQKKKNGGRCGVGGSVLALLVKIHLVSQDIPPLFMLTEITVLCQ